MVSLVFDASRATDPQISLTFGRNKSEFRWRDRREMAFSDFAIMLSRCAVGPKDGPCYTPAVFSGLVRKQDQATQIDMAVLDADCGHTLDEIREQVGARGWRAVIHSTHSHLSAETLISAAGFDRWSGARGGKGEISEYLLDKEGYLPRVIRSAKIADEISIDGKRHFIVSHEPCPKFRIVLPLDAPWVASDFESQGIANARWSERIQALASALRLRHDQSCTDTSRLFYLPRKRNADAEFLYLSLDGALCPLWSLPDAAPVGKQDIGGPFSAAPTLVPVNGGQWLPEEKRDHKVVTTKAGEWFDLTEWAAKYALRFEAAKAIRARAPGLFSSRGVSGVKHHLRCPNSDCHVTDTNDGTGSFVVNASEIRHARMPSLTGFQIVCMHNGCSGFDRLDHLSALLRDGVLTIADLTGDEFLTPERPQVDPSAIIQSARARSNAPGQATAGQATAGEAQSAPDDDDEPGEWILPEESTLISEDIYAELPGVLAEMQEWIMAGAHVRQPALTLGASLAFCATVIGQRVRIAEMDTRPNIYALGIAHSGAGKDWPQKAIKRIASEAGLFMDLIGMEDLASDSGVVSRVAEAPRGMMLLDEVSAMLSTTKAVNAEAHQKGIITTILKLYSASDSVFQGKAYADAKRQRIIIDQPCVSFYGSCVPDAFASALTSADIRSGLLSRMVVFDAGDHDPLPAPPKKTPVPQSIIDWVTAWNRLTPIADPVKRIGGNPVIEPRPVALTDDALKASLDFQKRIHQMKQRARSHGRDSLYVRVHQNALKFALIRACSVAKIERTDKGPEVNLNSLMIDIYAMRWGINLAWSTVRRMDQITEDIADNKYERDLIALRKFIREAGPFGRTPREFPRNSAGRHPKKVLEDYLETLARGGYAKWVEGIITKTRKRNAWVHRDFIHLHMPDAKE